MLCARSPVAGRAGRKNRSVGLISSHITKGAPSLFLPYVPLVGLDTDRSSGADLPPGRPAARSGSQTLAPKGGDAISGFVGSILASCRSCADVAGGSYPGQRWPYWAR